MSFTLDGGLTNTVVLTSASQQSSDVDRFEGLTPEDLIRAFRLMHTSRRLDDREIALKRQNRIFFQISGAGHEAVQVAAGMALRPGHDWFYLYYRDRALCLTLGVTPREMLQQAVGAADDPASGGRQMPSHWGHRQYHIVSSSSPTGTQFLQAVGCAEASRFRDPGSSEVTLVTGGDGATSEGEFWEALNAACLSRLGLLFLIEDNGYAISVPVECQTAGANISPLLAGFPLFRQEIDGTDFLASYRAMKAAAAWCREGNGPALVHAHVTRPYSHSLSDDERLYKTSAERKSEADRDPIIAFPKFLLDQGVIDRHMLQRITHEIDEEVHQATQQALRDEPPAPDTALAHLYSDRVDPTSEEFASTPQFTGNPVTMVDLINATLHEEMRRNSDLLVFGEDVADCSRAGNLEEVKGKGGVFKVTAGLQVEFGPRRSFNTPLAEASIVGRAIGMATRGLKPVAEIQFFDYIWPAMMQLRDELATLRWRSNGNFSCPAVIRVAIGGYLNGGAIYHSQCGESIFTHIPGLRVVMPSNALDACGLLRTALRADDPVMFLEHKRLYREPYNRSPHPGTDYTIPFGKARIVKPGRSLTVVTYGALVQKTLLAATQVERRKPEASIEILDLRTLSPYDWDSIRASVEKTSRVIVAHEDTLSWGYGAEIAARLADELFDRLDAPVRRVGALDTWVGYHPQLETAILPQTETLAAEIDRLLMY
ncbi:MAG TPA: dehydrogenase E1 component subunit alpha/beta [Bryobacteraceae bacterium]|nr:dehydrogenase E1 component subunit alpha/beta [Bryobacteraceae bacterium]